MTYLIALITTFLCATAIVQWRPLLDPLILYRGDDMAIQANHLGDPPRLGAVAISTGLVVGATADFLDTGARHAGLLLLSALPVVLSGLAEDMGHRVSPFGRIVASFIAALVAVGLLNLWIPRADMPGLDHALTFPLVAIAATLLISASYCHAVNLVDGMNGLAAISTLASACGIAVLAYHAGQSEVMHLAFLLIACLGGFLILNWPTARIFLGDAGAYGMGHVLVWLCIMLASASESVAIPALLLVLFWPVADLLHTVWRRILLGKSPFAPDNLHLHHKLRHALDLMVFDYNHRAKSNPATTLLLLPFIAAPVATGVFLQQNPLLAWLAFCLFALLFALTHALLTLIVFKHQS